MKRPGLDTVTACVRLSSGRIFIAGVPACFSGGMAVTTILFTVSRDVATMQLTTGGILIVLLVS